MSDDVEAQLRSALKAAMGARDRDAVSALRVALAALANAEAVPLDVAGAAVEAARRELSEDERRAVVAEVVALHPDTAPVLRPYC